MRRPMRADVGGRGIRVWLRLRVLSRLFWVGVVVAMVALVATGVAAAGSSIEVSEVCETVFVGWDGSVSVVNTAEAQIEVEMTRTPPGQSPTKSGLVMDPGQQFGFPINSGHSYRIDWNFVGDAEVWTAAEGVFRECVADTTVSVGVVDQSQGLWYLRDGSNGATTSFYFGNPGDFPIMGDWDCDGVDTPGLYRQSDGYVYLRNSNSQGVADIRFFFGNPGDFPLAGDFNGNECDTVSIYRPADARIFVINKLGSNDGGLGAADFSFNFGNVGDKPFVGDFNGDGIDTVGLHRESTGFVYYRDTLTTGIADNFFFYGDPGDQIITGDWPQKPPNWQDTVGIFRQSNGYFYLRFTNTQGIADVAFQYGNRKMTAVAGDFGDLAGGDTPPEPPNGTPQPTVRTFGDGVWIVGVDIAPGTYRTTPFPNMCFGRRLSGFNGTPGEVIAGKSSGSPIIVTIKSTDAGFESTGCNLWTNDMTPRSGGPGGPLPAGYWKVGTDMAPGLWESSGSSNMCFWERLSGFSWEQPDSITSRFTPAIPTQTIRVDPNDQGFNTAGCGDWLYLGP